jgi:uncharacterized protein (TIGR00255 family)
VRLAGELFGLDWPVRSYSPARMKSMTGYGRGECAHNGFKITVELSSVNRKQSEISVALPRELEPLESLIRDEINRSVARGRVTIKVVLHGAEASHQWGVQVNIPVARAYAREMGKLARELKLPENVTLDMLMRVPGVLQTEEHAADAEAFWDPVKKALEKGLSGLVKMRQREGAHLAKDLKQRMRTIAESVQRVEKAAPEMVKRFQQQLRERIRNAGLETPKVDDERLIKEVVYFADRSDISEELTRLKSHFKQFEEAVKSSEPVGRTLDFLAQEMNREINTIGSKSNDAVISQEVVKLKAELEKFREQVQNVE